MTASPDKKRKRRTALIAAAIVAGMTGMGFAAVPLYRAFCQATGYGGTTQTATRAPDRVLTREVTVRFDTNVAPGMPPISAYHRSRTFESAVFNMPFQSFPGR